MTIPNLWKHQADTIARGCREPDLGLLFEQGTGKTRTMIEIIRRLYANYNGVQKTIIFAPKIVNANWKKEFAMFSKINPKDILVLQKAGTKRIKDFLAAVGPDLSGSKIIITNYEAVQMDDLFSLLKQWGPRILVCDESQRVKNPDSLRAKKVVEIADLCAHNYVLTGTPILKNAMDIYMQYRILDRGQTFGRNFFAFRNMYFEDENAGFKGKQSYYPSWIARDEAYDILQDKISKKSVRVLKKDCLDLPPFVRQTVETEMSPEQTKAYKEMLREYITFLDKQTGPAAVVAQLAVTKSLRLQQIVSGFAKDEHGNIHRLDCPRLKVLEELLDDIARNHKVIVWAVFHENYKMIAELCDALKLPYREIHGGITGPQVQQNMEDFRKDPEVRVMIANQRAGGVGVNLVESDYSIYYSKGYSLEDDLQSEARNYRGGSEIHKSVTRIDIVCPGSIDELVNEALTAKQTISDKILSWKDKL